MWQDLSQALPVGNDHESRRKRSELFESLDVQGAGVCFQAGVIRGMSRRLPYIQSVSDIGGVLHRAFRATVDCVPPIAVTSVCQMDRNQLRYLLLYLWHYFKLWEQFATTNPTQGRKVSLRDIIVAVPMLQEWGCPVDSWEHDPERAYRAMQRGDLDVLFDDMADTMLRCSLQQWSATDSPEERQHAIHALRRINPEMVLDQARVQPQATTVRGPPAAGFGAGRSAMLSAMQGPSSTALRTLVDECYHTQYMDSYLAPRTLPPPKTPCKKSVFPLEPDTRPVYAWQKPQERVILRSAVSAKELSCTAAALQRPTMSPAPSRAALRSKLDRQLDMYSTAQMKNLLAVAGGLTVSAK